MKTSLIRNGWFASIVGAYLGSAVSAWSADPEFYATTSEGYFGTLDPISGTFSAIGQTNNVRGMGFGANGNLYGLGWGGTGQIEAVLFFLINVGSGVPVAAGSPTFSFSGTVWGMTATPNGTLYTYTVSGRSPTLLQTINPTNGITEVVGGMGVSLAGAFAGDEAGGLFITLGSAPEKLYSVNPSNGTATLIGATGSGVAVAMAFDGNTLYLVDVSGNIWTVSVATGAATKISTYAGAAAYGSILALASQFGTEEPAPVIKSIAPGDGIVTLTWSAVAGRAYQVEYSPDLAPGDWINLGSQITASATTATITDPVSVNAPRFYRVILLPL